jgi:flagellar biosynthesis/type III secretory pathway protein FliH
VRKYKYEYQSDFAKEPYAKGVEDGRQQGYDEGHLYWAREGRERGHVAGIRLVVSEIARAKGIEFTRREEHCLGDVVLEGAGAVLAAIIAAPDEAAWRAALASDTRYMSRIDGGRYVRTYYREGFEEGRPQGLEEGRKQGLVDGHEQGVAQLLRLAVGEIARAKIANLTAEEERAMHDVSIERLRAMITALVNAVDGDATRAALAAAICNDGS